MTPIDELATAVGPIDQPGGLVDRDDIDGILGQPLPDDYHEYVRRFPPGTLQDFLSVLHPDELADGVRLYREILQDSGARRGRVTAVHPEPGGLLPWAAVSRDYVVCWVTAGDEPALWTVAVYDPATAEQHRYGGPMGAFLLDFVHGRTGLAVLDYIHEIEPAPVFHPRPDLSTQDFGPAVLDPAKWQSNAPFAADPILPTDAGDQVLAVVGSGGSRAVDWTRAPTGLPLPADYRRLVEAGCPDQVGPIRVALPVGRAGTGLDLVELAVDVYRRMRERYDVSGGVRGPHYPEQGGLVPWGVTDTGGVVCWCPVGPDPDRWPVTAIAASFRASATYPMTMTRFLLQLLQAPELIYVPA